VAGLKVGSSRDIEGGGTFAFDESLEDIHMVIEDAAEFKAHPASRGRSCIRGGAGNDQVATDFMLWISRRKRRARFGRGWGPGLQLVFAFCRTC